MGTDYENHMKRYANPFIIIGVYYPPKTQQLAIPFD